MTQSKQKGLPTGYRLNEYTIVKQISSGGFSMVYVARDNRNQVWAIKEYLPESLACRKEDLSVTVLNVLDKESFGQGLKCFFEEARLLAGIDHPNIVHVCNFFRANQTVYMVMDYADGKSLHRYIESREKPVSEYALRKVFGKLVLGLREIHSHRLLHLDIKPANIYIRQNGSPVLLDFGAARQALRDDGRELASMYTPGFAAPEQYRQCKSSQELGPWTDMYALGACLYTAMQKKAPVAADKRMQEDMHVPAQKCLSHLYSNALCRLVDQCMALDPRDRPDSMLAIQKILSEPYQLPNPQSTSWLNRVKNWLQTF